jgi:hypothetical protein
MGKSPNHLFLFLFSRTHRYNQFKEKPALIPTTQTGEKLSWNDTNIGMIVRIKVLSFFNNAQLTRQAEIILYKSKLYAGWNLDIIQIKVIQDPIGNIDFLDTDNTILSDTGEDNGKDEKEDIDLSDLE